MEDGNNDEEEDDEECDRDDDDVSVDAAAAAAANDDDACTNNKSAEPYIIVCIGLNARPCLDDQRGSYCCLLLVQSIGQNRGIVK